MSKKSWKRNFYTILAGQAVSLITSAILQMAFIFYITEKTGSALMLSVASLAGFLPYAVFGPFIGVLVDRHSRKRIMILADLGVAAAGAALAAAAFFTEIPVWAILVVLFVRSVGTAFHMPAWNAATPMLVPKEALVKCSGYSQSLQSVSYIVSPALAALLYAAWDMNAIIALDVAGALVACTFVAFIRIPNPEPGEKTETGAGFFREMKQGFAVLRRDRGLFTLLLVGSLYMVVYMPINALYPLMSMGYFGGTPMHASIAEIAFASGMLAGGLALGAWGGFKKRTVTIFASIFLMGASLVVAGLLPANGFIVFAICCCVMGFSGPFYSGVQTALFQERIEPQVLGRVFSLTGSVVSLAMPIGLAISGLFADRLGVSPWFLVSGILIAGISLLRAVFPAIRGLDSDTGKADAKAE
jgi:DHA3 family macrolide efflux protein-like MFS transporter